MTPTEIQEINRLIAEAMGKPYITYPVITYRTDVDPWEIIKEKEVSYFNPHDSIQDVFEAVDVICPKGDGFAWCLSWSVKRQRFEFVISDHREGFPPKRYHGNDKETPEAAISLAIKQYLEEK